MITESRAGDDAINVTVTPGTIAYVTTGGESLVIKMYILLVFFSSHVTGKCITTH